MIALYHNRAWFALVAIERAAGNAWNCLIAYYRFSIGYNIYHPAIQCDIKVLPFACRFRGHFTRHNEAIHCTIITAGWLAACIIRNLQFISSPEIYTAVASLRIPELDMQLEISKSFFGTDI